MYSTIKKSGCTTSHDEYNYVAIPPHVGVLGFLIDVLRMESYLQSTISLRISDAPLGEINCVTKLFAETGRDLNFAPVPSPRPNRIFNVSSQRRDGTERDVGTDLVLRSH